MQQPLTLDEIADRLGGRPALARMLGLDASTPYSWSQVPARHVQRLASALGVDPVALRPDIFGPHDAGDARSPANADGVNPNANAVSA